MGVMLDADGYLFIVDQGNNRIVGSGPLGFRCIVGCSGSSGSALNQLQGPRSLAFDTYGNLYVSDRENDRIMAYTLFNSSCGKFHPNVLELVMMTMRGLCLW